MVLVSTRIFILLFIDYRLNSINETRTALISTCKYNNQYNDFQAFFSGIYILLTWALVVL